MKKMRLPIITQVLLRTKTILIGKQLHSKNVPVVPYGEDVTQFGRIAFRLYLCGRLPFAMGPSIQTPLENAVRSVPTLP